jgi:DNA-binding Lrp family transcriptional regulator
LPNNDVDKKILQILEDHPEGLSISEIAELVKLHRINVTKYLYRLVGSGEIVEREIGKVKLYYLKKFWKVSK